MKSKKTLEIVCVGTISVNKNQRMIVDAITLLPEDIANEVHVTFIGGKEEELKRYVHENKITNISFTGVVTRDIVDRYLQNADFSICASYSEGFGLPIIEGYSHGVPAIIPRTVDAYDDVYYPFATVAVLEHTAEAFAKGIVDAIHKEWDRVRIKSIAEKFSVELCSKAYLSFLRKCSKSGSPISTARIEEIYKNIQR